VSRVKAPSSVPSAARGPDGAYPAVGDDLGRARGREPDLLEGSAGRTLVDPMLGIKGVERRREIVER
jgi:hypothetical protein